MYSELFVLPLSSPELKGGWREDELNFWIIVLRRTILSLIWANFQPSSLSTLPQSNTNPKH